MAAQQKKILITGATGKQGRAVIEALESANGTPFQILAMTRNANSANAKVLAAKPNVTVVTGDSTTPIAIFKEHKPIYGVFSVTVLSKVPEDEQAKPLIDAAIENGVEHFVFTSVERGGDVKSDSNPTEIPHFKVKHVIEEYLKKQIAAKNSNMKWTILRPVAFMDNLTPDFMGKGFASMWAGIGQKPLQLIATSDIGLFAARAFNDPAKYQGRSISLAGDELNLKDGKKVFKETMGYDMPETFGFVGSGIKLASKEMGSMFSWFKSDGFGVDIQKLKQEEPKLQNFSTWLKNESGFKPQ
ncbi:NAD(P)-binding Rossmann-fold containing protein [Glarea lozoyensis ATCC 20868]|uniref:NAD(P)-binding Rossmann-fold containing protein n=1 Tax=Glarea lozoyensis (strain ATCC 20868 / MF5171) TaxID=1116229 RepID=S3D4A9_GLAL2|nr:NAD(P)-binding Rossmann-fold containing protein [Glarea lozoyensis ATCC 20868]EPE31954.1 NAD(P)-binding Rossmann-fold containing protein [Glarea lozoyensis ATCC 20868]